MNDNRLRFLQKAHRASGLLLLGQMPEAQDLAALQELVLNLGPVVKHLEAQQAPANGNGRSGRFFRFLR